MNYDELVAALRVEPFEVGSYGMAQQLNAAADAIEALQAEIKRQNAEWESVMATATEAEAELVAEMRRLQAEAERLKGEKE